MRALTILLLVLLAIAATPAAAKDTPSPLDWIPADFEGFLRVDLTRPNDTLIQLNMSYYVAAFLQPSRAGEATQRSLDDYFPVDLFDVEGAAFQTNVLPWLSDEFVVAYRSLGPDFVAAQDDVLLILPTDDAFAAASALSSVTTAQDFPSRTRYRDSTIFVGDQTAIAFTPSAVLVGAEPVLHAALDAEAGETERLVDSSAYTAVAVEAEAWPLVAYLGGEAPRHALSVLLNGDSSAEPALEALGAALQPYNGDSLEAALLTGAVDSLGLGLRADAMRGTVQASVVLQPAIDTGADVTTGGESPLLSYIPRNAMLVQHGGDARAAFYDALVAAPVSSYFSDVLSSAFANPAATAAPPTPSAPDAVTIDAAVGGFVSALSAFGDFDLDADLATHLEGDYALALLPRPNNPAAVTGARYDVLLIAETGDAEAAVSGVTTLARTVLGLDGSALSDEGEAGLRSLYSAPGTEPLLQVGAVDGNLVVGTGGAVQAALRAGSGDNRLVNVTRWQNVSREAEPTLYLDLNALFATFAPTAGGPVSTGIGQLGASVRPLDGGRYRIDVIVTLPPAM